MKREVHDQDISKSIKDYINTSGQVKFLKIT